VGVMIGDRLRLLLAPHLERARLVGSGNAQRVNIK